MPENMTAMTVFDRCGDEWITRGGDGSIIALPGAAIETAMDVTGITDMEHRQMVFDQVKLASRAIVKAAAEERDRQRRTQGA